MNIIRHEYYALCFLILLFNFIEVQATHNADSRGRIILLKQEHQNRKK